VGVAEFLANLHIGSENGSGIACYVELTNCGIAGLSRLGGGRWNRFLLFFLISFFVAFRLSRHDVGIGDRKAPHFGE
jgi:hypothetical protein